MRLTPFPAILFSLLLAAPAARADTAADLAACADERVKTEMLPMEVLAGAQAACDRALEGAAGADERQKAAFFRGLLRFLQVMQAGMALEANPDGSMPDYRPPTPDDVAAALGDVETAIALDGPLKGEALALRITIRQTVGQSAEAAADIETAITTSPDAATPLVQRALEAERRGDAGAALADLSRALEIDPRSGPALTARAFLLRRLGHLAPAREDLAAAIALGPPYRRLALIQKSEIELRIGDMRAAFTDLTAAARETADMTGDDARAMNRDLLLRAGNLALDSLKDPAAAEALFHEAAALGRGEWGWQLGLGRSAEARGERDKAITIYEEILAGTRAMPNLLERNEAGWRLRRLTQPLLQQRAGSFLPGFEFGIVPARAAPDGLKRLAFVIGAGGYSALPRLPNATRDATAIANRLADIGFDAVEIAEDIARANLTELPRHIAERASEADIVVVFYAGHGVETGGTNYLIPVDAVLENEGQLRTTTLALQDLVAAAGKARKGALVIVDACRDDPFAEAKAVAASRGLARPLSQETVPDRMHMGLAAASTPPRNSVILYSTQPGETAADGEDLDSPFVIGLPRTLSTPGLSLSEVVSRTATEVSGLTNGRQVPAAYGDAGDVRFLPEMQD